MNGPVLRVRGARTHNLRGVDLDLPREALVAITGPSGSGKSSLAFDTIFAEGRRHYMESLSLGARQWLAAIPAPDVDLVDGLSPAIGLEQNAGPASPRSTVGTATEVYDFLRLLFAKLGEIHSLESGERLRKYSRQEMVDAIMRQPAGTKFSVRAHIVKGQAGDHAELMESVLSRGFIRAVIDESQVDLTALPPNWRLDPEVPHEVRIIVDRLSVKPGIAPRLSESLESALELANGQVEIAVVGGRVLHFSERFIDAEVGFVPDELTLGHFSFNSPQGACPGCDGLGTVVDPERDGGEGDARHPCPRCDGSRLGPLARRVLVHGKPIFDLAALSVDGLHELLSGWAPSDAHHGELERTIVGKAKVRLQALQELGLGYLGIDRPITTLSAGEHQRLRLATQVGSPLTGVTYVLDEPSAGLHPSDTGRLIALLRDLRRRGNMVIVVEHDAQVIRACDHLVDLGPGAGVNGGTVVASGPTAEVLADDDEGDTTAGFVSGRCRVDLGRNSPPAEDFVRVLGAKGHNLRGDDVAIPIGRMTCVTGVSGAGKSSLVMDTLLPVARHRLHRAKVPALVHDYVEGLERFERVVAVDQTPIGQSPRSNPATYTGVFAELRRLFAHTKEARQRGWTAARFSFNRAGGRCEGCRGDGVQKVEMHFLPDAWVRCAVCGGARYERQTLAVRFRGKTIADVLDLEVEQACVFFANQPRILRPLEVLRDVGLGYVCLGQSAQTLSGGEAQRIKLAKELARGRREDSQTLFVLDEPTTGLHFTDIGLLLKLLERLVDGGHTVLMISHDVDVVRNSDHIIELGPGAGPRGGHVIFTGDASALGRADTPTGRVLTAMP